MLKRKSETQHTPSRSSPATHASLAAGSEAKELSFQCLEWAPIFLRLLPLGPVTWTIASVLKRKGTFLWRFGPQPAEFEPLPSSHPSCPSFHSCSMGAMILFLFGFWRFFKKPVWPLFPSLSFSQGCLPGLLPCTRLAGSTLPGQASLACRTGIRSGIKVPCEGQTRGTGALLPRLPLSPGSGVKGMGSPEKPQVSIWVLLYYSMAPTFP